VVGDREIAGIRREAPVKASGRVVLGDFRIDELATQRFEAFECAFLVRPISRE
jgi:hypothetical protein